MSLLFQEQDLDADRLFPRLHPVRPSIGVELPADDEGSSSAPGAPSPPLAAAVTVRRRPRSATARYLTALAAPLIVAGLMQLTWPLFQTNPISPYLLAVTVCAWYGGLGPGLASVIVSVLLSNYFFVEPYFFPWRIDAPANQIRLLIFGTVGPIICLLTEVMHNARRRAELNLDVSRLSEDRYRALVAATSQIVWSTTTDGHIVAAVPAWSAITGQRPEEMRGRGWLDAVHEDDRQGVEDVWSGARPERRAYESEIRIRQRDGGYREYAMRRVPLFDDDGTTVREWVASASDISDRKRAEAALRERQEEFEQALDAARRSEDRFKLFARVTHDAIWDLDILTGELWWSEGFTALFGYAPDELESTLDQWASLVSPEDRDRVVRGFQALIGRSGVHWSDEYQFLRKDGTYAYVLARGYVIRNAAGRPLRLVGGMTDITARRASEKALAQQAALLDKAQDAIIVSDLDHRITYWNKSAERFYDWTSSEAIGHSSRELLKQDTAVIDGATRMLRDKGDWVGELSQVGRNGRSITVESRWTLVRDDGGRPQAILAINTDITSRKKLEQQFLRAQRMESIGTLAGGIAHDLNNALTPILMSIELLSLGERDPDRLDVLGTIESSARRGADMVRQVLSFARGVESRRLEVRVTDLLREVEKFCNDTFLKHIHVRSIVPDGLGRVSGDATQLQQVLVNLCVNARDAMPDGGALTLRAANVSIAPHATGAAADVPAGEYVLVQIEDTGTGIPQRVINQIFEPFFTTKELGKGTGLGLSTSLAIVRSHGGAMRVSSEPGVGTRFSVYLPVDADADADGADRVLAGAARHHGHGELILVVDDEEAVRQITQRTLEAFGYRVLTAADGAEAVAMFAERREEIDVVLTDMMMPVMDGPAAIEALLKLDPALRIIAASGLDADGRGSKAAPAGMTHFLPKPYAADTLLTAVHEVLTAPRSTR